MLINPTKTKSEQGRELVSKLLNRFQENDTACSKMVSEILAAVREKGDEALLEYTRRFDAPNFQLSQLQVTREEFDRARTLVDDSFMDGNPRLGTSPGTRRRRQCAPSKGFNGRVWRPDPL